MFGRVRIRLTLLYIALMGVTLALVATGILALGAQQARQTDDQSLRLRAERLADFAGRYGGRPPPSIDPSRVRTDLGPPDRLEQEGIIDYQIPVRDGRILNPPFGSISGLPDNAAAQAAIDAGGPRFGSRTLDAGQVRMYNLPVVRDGQVVAVVQVARSQYFVNATVRRLIIVVVAVGVVGLLLSGIAAYWLAGRTLRPIAASLQRQRDFTADASHELRTPLALVRGNAELLLRHPERRIGEYADAVQDMVDESDRLTRLVSGLLTLARADGGHAELSREPVDLSDLTAKLLRDLQPLAEEKGLALRGDIASGVTVPGDGDRLRELLVIVLENALRYTHAGGVTLSLVREGHIAVLEVRDTGPGIEAVHLPRIFERFYRADAARSAEAGGAGLGLAIAAWIAEAHGGRISVASTLGVGSVFTVRLPHAASSAAQRHQAETTTV